MVEIKNYIDGNLVKSINKETIDIYSPSNGQVFACCPNSVTPDLDCAIKSGKKALNFWSNLPQNDRSEYLDRIADLIDSKLDEFSYAETLDNGKPLKLSRSLDIPRAIQNLKFFANCAKEQEKEIYQKGSIYNEILRRPLGLIGTISPWNLPLYLFTWKIAPALAIGNCVIAKPSEITPYTAYLFSKVCIDAKLPKGVLNILHGYGNLIGNQIVKHKEIKAISFTGGTDTGKKIAIEASKSLKKVSLELGGKNPVIIFDDCNYKKMLKSIINSSFLNQGQICLAGSRIYIQDTIYDKFKNDFLCEVNKLKTGSPFDESVDQGAIVSFKHLQKIKEYVDLAESEGGSILTGGGTPSKVENELGWYFSPTVIEGLSNDSALNQKEVFGPVVTISKFKNENHAIDMANHSSYGLAAIIWTEDKKRAQRLAQLVESGLVWINCWLERDLRTPFGGVKESGIGREGGKYALDFFTETKNICTKSYD